MSLPAPSSEGPRGHLVLLRHGETEWSKSGQHTGVTDIPLTAEGEAAARRAGTLVGPWHFARVVSSPLQRARRTAALAGLEDVVVDDRLREWDYGGYEGLTTAQIRARVGHDWTVFEDGVVPGATPGETIEAVAARAASILGELMPTLVDRDVCLVAHGHYLRVLTSVFLRQEPRIGAQLLLDAGAVCVLEWEHGIPAVRVWNETARS